MAKETSTIQDVRMEPADNGVMIGYTEKIKTPDKGHYDNCSYEYRKIVVERADGEDDDALIDRAGTKFVELWKQQYGKEKEEKE